MLPNEKIIPLQSSNSAHEEVAPYNVETPPMQKHSKGFIQLPREILEDSRWQSSRLRYQKVFLTICMHAIYGSPKAFSVGSTLIQVEPGQFCFTERSLAELCNQGVVFEEDMVDKSTVRRAIEYYSSCDFLARQVNHGNRQNGKKVNQQVNHQKSIVTVKHLTTCEIQKYKSEPTSEVPTNHQRTTKEKDIIKVIPKKERIHHAPASPDAVDLFSFFEESRKKHLPDVKRVIPAKQTEYFDKLLKHHEPEKIRRVITFSHTDSFWMRLVHLPSYLHKKFDTLAISEKCPVGKKSSVKVTGTSEYHNAF